jgi:hypothetical protein
MVKSITELNEEAVDLRRALRLDLADLREARREVAQCERDVQRTKLQLLKVESLIRQERARRSADTRKRNKEAK